MEDPADRATYLWVAETILREHRRPLSARQIVNLGLERGLFSDKDLSRTPQKSMQARLSVDIVAKSESSQFLRVAKGRFFLRDLVADHSLSAAATEYKAVPRGPAQAQEEVLVVHRQDYREHLTFQGLSVDYEGTLDGLMSAPGLTYIPRTIAEVDVDYKQFITYTIIQQRDRVLAFRRGRYNRAASFLRGARCIGFGGHVTADDLNLFTLGDYGIRGNAAREISEEIRFKSGRPKIDPTEIEVVGIINDDSSDVGVRHVGIILRYWAPETPEWAAPIRGEASIAQLRWMKTQREELDLLQFEYWSQLVLRTFFPTFIASRPTYRIVRRAPFQAAHLLCVTGSIGSGKSITTRRLCERHGYQQINTGKLVATLLGIPPVPDTPRGLFQALALEFITSPDGPKRLARAIADAASALGGNIIIDGIRQLQTLEVLRSISSVQVATIFVHTPADIAFRMYALREAGTPNMTLSDFMTIYNAPVEGEVRYMISEADVVIYNWIGLDEYELVIERLVSDLGLTS